MATLASVVVHLVLLAMGRSTSASGKHIGLIRSGAETTKRPAVSSSKNNLLGVHKVFCSESPLGLLVCSLGTRRQSDSRHGDVLRTFYIVLELGITHTHMKQKPVPRVEGVGRVAVVCHWKIAKN